MSVDDALRQVHARKLRVWSLAERTNGKGWRAYCFRPDHPGGVGRAGEPSFLLPMGEGATAAEALLAAAGLAASAAAAEDEGSIFG